MIVREIGAEHGDWERYVARSPAASFYHRAAWGGVIGGAFGHRAHYLTALDGTDVRGVLPLVEMHSTLFGHFLVSMPFLNYGGIVSDTPEAERALARAAVELAVAHRASHVELRQSSCTRADLGRGWALRTHKAALVVRLGASAQLHWDGLRSRLRGKVRKAERSGARFEVAGPEALDAFYAVYALNMRDLGTPVYSRAFFRGVLAQTGQRARVLLVTRNGRPAAAAIALADGDRIELPWICQRYAEATFNVNEFLYWNAIVWALGTGAVELDLGRSTVDAGTYRFKLQWNPEVRPLHWYTWTPAGTTAPQLDPKNPRYAFAVRCWKRLPLRIANRIGPMIVRNIP